MNELTKNILMVVAIVLGVLFLVDVTLYAAGATTEPIEGQTCDVVGTNNWSVHTDNVFVVEHGPEVIRVPGIEDERNKVTEFSFVAAGEINAYVEINAVPPLTSFEWVIECTPPTPTTTSTPTTSTTTSTTTTVTTPPPSTTVPPPVAPPATPIPGDPKFTG